MRTQEVLELLEEHSPNDYVYIMEDGCYGGLYLSDDGESYYCETCGSTNWIHDQGYVTDLLTKYEGYADESRERFSMLNCEFECIRDSGSEFDDRFIELFDEYTDCNEKEDLECALEVLLDENDLSHEYAVVTEDTGLRIINRKNLNDYYLNGERE